MELKNYFAQDSQGNILAMASVYVYQAGTQTLVTGLKDKEGNAISNPFASDSSGLIQYAAENGIYDMRVSSGGRDYTLRVSFSDSAGIESDITKVIQSNSAGYQTDSGVAANAYVVNLSPAVTSLSDGMIVSFTPAHTNTGESTLVVNGLPSQPIVGGALIALQGGEIAANGKVTCQYDLANTRWCIIASAGGAKQVSDAQQSHHTPSLSQVQNMVASAGGDAYVKTIKGLLDKWNAAKNRGASNPARFAFVGDSNVAGEGTASGTNGLADANSTNMTKKLASLAGFQSESFFGDKNVTISSSSLPLYDTRITLGSGWSSDTVASEILGGRFLIASAGASGKLTFTPASPFSKFRLWYPTTTGLNTALGIYVDNVLIDTINQAAADALAYKDYIVSLGSHSIAIGVGSSGYGYVSGIEILDGSQNPIMFNAGYCALSTQNMVANTKAWSHRRALVALAPDFTVIYATINDASNATTANVFLSNIENIVSDLYSVSNGCLCVGFPYDGISVSNGLYEQYAEGLRRIADDYGWFYVDSRAVFGNSYKKATARGYSYNAKHPNKAGGDAFAEYLYSLFSSSSM